MVSTKVLQPVLLLVALSAVVGCRGAESAPAAYAAPSRTAAAPPVVDSIQPIEEEIARFQESVDRAPPALSGGAASRDALVAGFVRALVQSDTAALAAMVLDPAEFIYLYFPHTVYTSPPYQMDPAIIWFQRTNHSSRGLSRVYRRFAGAELILDGYRCAKEMVEGPNRLSDDCIVRLKQKGEAFDIRLFGMILERAGHFKFVTYSNWL